MRILHILDHSVPLHSGYSFRTLAILREQRALGWETCHLTSPKQGVSASDEETVDGLTFYRTAMPLVRLPALPGASEIAQMRATARRIREAVDRTRPDLLHAHSPALTAIPAAWVGRQTGLPVVYEVRAFWEDGSVEHGTSKAGGLRYRMTRALETFALKRVDAITTICEGLRRDIAARGIPIAKLTVIPNAVDPQDFLPGGIPDQDLKQALGLAGTSVIGYIGSFYAYEGLSTLLAAMPVILRESPQVRLLLAGGGPEDAALRRQAAELQLSDKIVFTGRVPHAEIQRYYDLIDLLVYPRLASRLTDLVTPMKPLEAMAMEKLFVASDVGGHRELLPRGVSGRLFRAGDPADLARGVLEILAAPERWPALRREGRDYVLRERTWSGSVERYRAVYERCLDGHRSVRGPAGKA
jgi:PEP-CTERM/exosortase A-associated glycosyltransferase